MASLKPYFSNFSKIIGVNISVVVKKATAGLVFFFLFSSFLLIDSAFAEGVSVKANQSKANQSTKNILKTIHSLPEKSLTLDLVLLGGLKSDTFKLIRVQGLNSQALQFSRKAPLDTRLGINTTRVNDRSAATRPGASFSTKSVIHGLELSKNFATGTSVSLRSDYQDVDSQATAFFRGGEEMLFRYYENKLSLNIRQNLWRDAFGYATRKSLQSLKIQEGNVENELIIQGEDWAYSLIQTYYRAWLLKQKAFVEQENYQRQKRLLKITNLKFKKGTAERSDVLQVQSAEKNTKNNLAGVKQELGDIWRKLVVSLGFPEDWLRLDPIFVPLKIDQPVSKAQTLCKGAMEPEKNWEVVSLKNKAQSAALDFKAAKNKLWPETYLGVKLTTNGVDPDSGNSALKTSLENQNQGVFVELGFSMPLGNYNNKASLVKAGIKDQMAQTQLSIIKENIKTSWENQCTNLLRLLTKRKDMRATYKLQKKRAQLDERRFRIGRLPAFNAIQAANDSAFAHLNLKQTEVDLRLVSWDILRMQGRLADHLKKLVSDVKSSVKSGVKK